MEKLSSQIRNPAQLIVACQFCQLLRHFGAHKFDPRHECVWFKEVSRVNS